MSLYLVEYQLFTVSVCSQSKANEKSLHNRNGRKDVDKVETQLADRNLPGRALKSKVKDDLSCNTVDSAEENPSAKQLAGTLAKIRNQLTLQQRKQTRKEES